MHSTLLDRKTYSNKRTAKKIYREKLENITRTLTLSAGTGKTCNGEEYKDLY